MVANCSPSLIDNFTGRYEKPFALPRVVVNDGGGLVVEENVDECAVVKSTRNEAANSRD
jgi:hypothetical protein